MYTTDADDGVSCRALQLSRANVVAIIHLLCLCYLIRRLKFKLHAVMQLSIRAARSDINENNA